MREFDPDIGCRYHERIAHCPLYVASHDPFGDGCFRGIERRCAASHDPAVYRRMLERVNRRDPETVAVLELRESGAKPN